MCSYITAIKYVDLWFIFDLWWNVWKLNGSMRKTWLIDWLILGLFVSMTQTNMDMSSSVWKIDIGWKCHWPQDQSSCHPLIRLLSERWHCDVMSGYDDINHEKSSHQGYQNLVKRPTSHIFTVHRQDMLVLKSQHFLNLCWLNLLRLLRWFMFSTTWKHLTQPH